MEKKLISLVFGRRTTQTLAQNLTRDLTLVFGNQIEIEYVYLSGLSENEPIQGDAVLVTYPGLVNRLKTHVADMSRVIIISRTVTEETIYRLYDIPKGTSVLVVNDTRDTTDDTVSMLYQLGIRHLNMVPYYPGETGYAGIQVAVTPGEAHRVPREISTVVDIGDRRLDMQTFLDIFTLFNCASDHIKQALIRYADTIVELHAGIKTRYIRSYTLGESLRHIMNLQNLGILVTDEKFCMRYWNTEVIHIFSQELNEQAPFSEYLSTEIVRLLTSQTFSKDLVSVVGQQYMVSRDPILVMERVTGFCFTFESVANIRKSGNDLSQRLKRQGLFARYTFDNIICRNPTMLHRIALAKKAAASDYTILITGESGTGKELFAQSIHNASKRRNKPFVAVNCAAMPESLLESELFGYEEGTFTGAKRGGKIGLFEQADGGTIFLDEIGDMPYSLQAKLLRVLQERQITRLGGDSVFNINVRILAATNANLKELIRAKKFREDLFYRLNVFPLSIPPLRERREDILPLFIALCGVEREALPESICHRLIEYSWPGNVRELRNAAEYYALMGTLECLDDGAAPVQHASIGESGNLRCAILDILKKRSREGLNTGRGSLKQELADQGIIIGDTRLERVLANMSQEKVITRKRGPGGIQLL